jgi:hypothetical protein
LAPRLGGPFGTSVLLLSFLAACSEAGPPPADPGGAIHAGELPVIELTEDLRIGDRDDPDAGFTRVAAVVSLPDGRLVVGEAEARELRFFDSAGGLLHTVGGRGEGPGEFELLGALGVVGDTLWVRDPSNLRFTLFTLEGEPLTTIPMRALELDQPAPGVIVTAEPWSLRADGLLEGRVRVRNMAGPPETLTGSAPILLFDAEGLVVDTLGFREWRVEAGMRIGGQPVPPLPPPFPEDPLHLELGEGAAARVERPTAAAGDEGAFTVTGLGGMGDTLFHRRVRYAPVPVPEAVRDSILDTRTGALTMILQESEAAIRQELASVLPLPDFHSPVSEARVGGDGSLWLRRENDGSEVRRWVVLNEDGTPRGKVHIPARGELHWSDGTHAWVVEPDEFEVPWVVRYRLGGG